MKLTTCTTNILLIASITETTKHRLMGRQGLRLSALRGISCHLLFESKTSRCALMLHLDEYREGQKVGAHN